jgi:lipoate-protein ligase A
VGAVPAARLVTGDVTDLYDYTQLRRRASATMTVVKVTEPFVVLGSAQPLETLRPGVFAGPIRRRRGGGGAVLAQPGDLWIDWWIPPNDPRWTKDVRESAVAAGRWWRDALSPLVTGIIEIHEGPLTGASPHRVACFAGRGPGEIFVDGRKAVGLTQWRVREGTLISSVLLAHPSVALVGLLAHSPQGLAEALDHHTRATLGLGDVRATEERLARTSASSVVERRLIPA